MVGYVATIGMFDGVHRGHQFVLQRVVQEARRRGLQSMAITFDHQPRREKVLLPLDEKLKRLSLQGIDRVVMLPFDDQLKAMSAQEFMEHELHDRLDVKVLMTGYDNRFGHNRAEGFEDYVYYGQELGIEVLSLPPAPSEGRGDVVSSSLIRQCLSEGEVGKAGRCLGYYYLLIGHVTHGEHIGTTLGFPTANIVLDDPRQLIPLAGAYAVQVDIGEDKTMLPGIMNIGCRPTFDGHTQTLEVHIMGLDRDLYGQRLMVSLVERLRDERRFDSPEALKVQLQEDVRQAEKRFKNYKI